MKVKNHQTQQMHINLLMKMIQRTHVIMLNLNKLQKNKTIKTEKMKSKKKVLISHNCMTLTKLANIMLKELVNLIKQEVSVEANRKKT